MGKTPPPASQPEGLDRAPLIVAGVVLLGAVMSILDTTVVNWPSITWRSPSPLR